jgi:hypothetical protein
MKVVNLGELEGTASQMRLAFDIGTWCTEHGLAFNNDYDWTFVGGNFCVRFYDHCEDMATLFVLRWVK